MDLFENKNIDVMLIGKEDAAFDSEEYIFELKFDGIRALAYLNESGTDLRNKRHLSLNAHFPELHNIHKQVRHTCILDGELYVFHQGRSDFYYVQKRVMTQNTFKISLQSSAHPATFTAFDILYLDGKDVSQLPLMERKKLMEGLIQETSRFNQSRFIDTYGIDLFEKTTQHDLEGIVAKHKMSRYHFGKRTKEWIKCKNMLDEDFVIAGYIPKENHMTSLVLALYEKNQLIYQGHVTLGVSLDYIHKHTSPTSHAPFDHEEETHWITPYLCGSVKFMEYTQNGGMRQPVFKGFREDKDPKECQIKKL